MKGVANPAGQLQIRPSASEYVQTFLLLIPTTNRPSFLIPPTIDVIELESVDVITPTIDTPTTEFFDRPHLQSLSICSLFYSMFASPILLIISIFLLIFERHINH